MYQYLKNKNEINLDNASTTNVSDAVLNSIESEHLLNYIIQNNYYNPSSVYQNGRNVRDMIETTRKNIARFINCNDTNNIIFTSGGSASNTLGVKGYYNKHKCTTLYSPICHKSILKCTKSIPNAQSLKVDKRGFIDIYNLKERLLYLYTNTIPSVLVVLEYANSEIGTIQNVKEITDLVHAFNGVVYLDCTGSFSQIPIDVQALDVDMLGFSAHKIGGLKGTGVFYKKSNITLEPLIYGTQEQGLVGGTENTLGIYFLDKVIANYHYDNLTSTNRDYVYHYIMDNIADTYLIGANVDNNTRLPHNLYMCFRNIDGEYLMSMLDEFDILVSTGSACNSGNKHPSPTLTAINLNNDDIHSCIRMTFNGQETTEQLNYICEKLKQCVTALRMLA